MNFLTIFTGSDSLNDIVSSNIIRNFFDQTLTKHYTKCFDPTTAFGTSLIIMQPINLGTHWITMLVFNNDLPYTKFTMIVISTEAEDSDLLQYYRQYAVGMIQSFTQMESFELSIYGVTQNIPGNYISNSGIYAMAQVENIITDYAEHFSDMNGYFEELSLKVPTVLELNHFKMLDVDSFNPLSARFGSNALAEVMRTSLIYALSSKNLQVQGNIKEIMKRVRNDINEISRQHERERQAILRNEIASAAEEPEIMIINESHKLPELNDVQLEDIKDSILPYLSAKFNKIYAEAYEISFIDLIRRTYPAKSMILLTDRQVAPFEYEFMKKCSVRPPKGNLTFTKKQYMSAMLPPAQTDSASWISEISQSRLMTERVNTRISRIRRNFVRRNDILLFIQQPSRGKQKPKEQIELSVIDPSKLLETITFVHEKCHSTSSSIPVITDGDLPRMTYNINHEMINFVRTHCPKCNPSGPEGNHSENLARRYISDYARVRK